MYKSVVLASIVATASGKVFTENASHQKYMWDQFKTEHGKHYETFEEEVKRFNYFLENLKIADLRNEAEMKAGGSAVHGITKFSDMSQSEFQSKMLKSDISMRSKDRTVAKVDSTVTDATVDWTGIYTTPVKDQGYCGSCWAFSATEQIESDTMRTLGKTYVLSPEQLVQCSKTDFGCNGGWTEHAYNYVKKAGGIELDSAYPYTSYQGVTGTCQVDSKQFVVTVNSYTTVASETDMAAYVQATGPLSVCVDASQWNSYTGGILYSCGTDVDHCVQAVGVNPSANGGYWKVRNSWGTSWGESGFIRLAYGQNTCAVASDPTYVAVALK